MRETHATYNPQASYDLGVCLWGIGLVQTDVQRDLGFIPDQPTISFAADREEAEFQAWCDAQVESALAAGIPAEVIDGWSL